mmetsp:Transcript_1219/g.2008  ORF Transcript_1219/g.2008 Transcript_1219/m.2008 type:complete len:104 (+) Transcript_1219:59-370(+)
MRRVLLSVALLPAAAVAFAPVAPSGLVAGPVFASGLALRPSSLPLRAEEKKGGFMGGLFGGGGDAKQDKPKDDLEDAIDDWKEIGFDIDEVIKAEEESKKDKK